MKPNEANKEDRMYQVNQRLVVTTNILIEAKSKKEAQKLAAAFVTKIITKTIKEESCGSDKAKIEYIDATCQEK